MASGGGFPDVARRAALRTAKLRALVSARWGVTGGQAEGEHFGPGAALVASGDADQAWLYLVDRPERGLGVALVWAEHHRTRHLEVLCDDAVAVTVLARQAGFFADPVTAVWRIEGETLVEAEPAPPAAVRAADPAPELVDLFMDAGLEIVVEGGLVRGEVLGLEVARIDGSTLQVGVGQADRELTALLHGDLAPLDQLARAAEVVRDHRHADAPRHPLNQLVPERWLRAVLCREPGLVGLAALRPAEGARPRPNLRDPDLAVALGEMPDQTPVVVACSVGIDLDLVPTAADARAALHPDADLWLVLPERDDHPTTRRLASSLRAPARVVTVSNSWRRL